MKDWRDKYIGIEPCSGHPCDGTNSRFIGCPMIGYCDKDDCFGCVVMLDYFNGTLKPNYQLVEGEWQ